MTRMAAARLRVSVATPDSAPAIRRRFVGAGSRPAFAEELRFGGTGSEVRGLGPWLVNVAGEGKGNLSVAIVSDHRILALNRQFRGKDAVTDVLSFPCDPSTALAGGRAFLGDIVIARGSIDQQAKAAGHTSSRPEVRVLALHGLLHLIGYDHDVRRWDDGSG